jgi:hypothetical protein
MNKLPTDEETRRQKVLLRAFGEAFAANREARSLDIAELHRTEWIDGFENSRFFVVSPSKSKYFSMGFCTGKEFIERFFCNER